MIKNKNNNDNDCMSISSQSRFIAVTVLPLPYNLPDVGAGERAYFVYSPIATLHHQSSTGLEQAQFLTSQHKFGALLNAAKITLQDLSNYQFDSPCYALLANEVQYQSALLGQEHALLHWINAQIAAYLVQTR